MKKSYSFPVKINRKIGRAMYDFSMFEDGDNVLVAVSGGVDSLTLACVLKKWQEKAPIHFKLTACYIDHGFWRKDTGTENPAKVIAQQLSLFSLDCEIIQERHITEIDRTCFLCSKNRRSQLFDLARDFGYNKIAFGHHKDDLIETFLLNAMYSGNISTMVPKQGLFDGTLFIVRPLAYLEKNEVITLSEGFKLEPVKNLCPLSDNSKREKVRVILSHLYSVDSGIKASLFAALFNVRTEYLLKK